MRAVPGAGVADLSTLRRAWRLTAGEDGPGRPALPAGELLHPVTLAALVALVVNDHALKHSPLAGWVTGKLSDVAGVLVFPLVLTGALDTAAWLGARAGLGWDFTLRRWKLAAAIAATAALMLAIKLSPAAAAAVAAAVAAVWGHAAIRVDPTDLVALPALWGAWRIGLAELRRGALGRLEHAARRARRGRPLSAPFGDAARAGAPAATAAALDAAVAAWLRGGPADDVARGLAALRAADAR